MRDAHLVQNKLIEVSPVYDKVGNLIGCLYMAEELNRIANQITSESRIANQEYARLLIQSAQYLIYMQDLEGTYIFFSASPTRTHWPWEIIGKTPYDIYDSPTATKQMLRIEEVKQLQRDFDQKMEMTWGGMKLLFVDTISPVKDPEGNIIGVLTISRRLWDNKATLPKHGSTPREDFCIT